MLQSIQDLARKHGNIIRAPGVPWGLDPEQSFGASPKRQASSALVTWPMAKKRAQIVGTKMGIQAYSYAKDVYPALFA